MRLGTLKLSGYCPENCPERAGKNGEQAANDGNDRKG